MIQVRKSHERGQGDHGWLKSFHSFSFANYYDPEFMGFRDLRVINEDFVAGGGGFPMHGHKDMEILTYVIDGALQHKDSEGNSEVIRSGEIQKMSAGTGIHHSEFNADPDKAVHLLQIWILPDRRNLAPGYAQEAIDWKTPGLKLIAAPQKHEGAVQVFQDVVVYAGKTKEGSVELPMKSSRYYWLQVIEGELEIMGKKLGPGDAAAIKPEQDGVETLVGPGHFLFFDLN